MCLVPCLQILQLRVARQQDLFPQAAAFSDSLPGLLRTWLSFGKNPRSAATALLEISAARTEGKGASLGVNTEVKLHKYEYNKN